MNNNASIDTCLGLLSLFMSHHHPCACKDLTSRSIFCLKFKLIWVTAKTNNSKGKGNVYIMMHMYCGRSGVPMEHTHALHLETPQHHLYWFNERKTQGERERDFFLLPSLDMQPSLIIEWLMVWQFHFSSYQPMLCRLTQEMNDLTKAIRWRALFLFTGIWLWTLKIFPIP